MAIDPTKAKRNIDFDTYVAPREGSTVNWAEQAKVISDAFTGVATDRQERKKAIDDDTKANIDKLNELDSYDNQTLMDMTIDGANAAANVIYEAEQKMKRGELRPSEFQKLKNNISSGFTQFQKNAKSWESDFKRYTERMQGKDGVQSSSLEQYLGTRLESFGNLRNLQLVTNPDTGMLAFARIDEEGNIMSGPDDLISINRMSAMSKQEIDRYDVGGWVEQAAGELGDYVIAGNASSMGKDGSSRAVLTVKDFMQTPEAEKYIDDKVAAAMSNPFDIGSIIADNSLTNDKGEKFRPGAQEDFDKWNEENPGKEEQNPVIVMGYKENGVVVEPAFTEGQREAAAAYMKRSLKAKLGRDEELKESSYQPAQPSPASITKGRQDRRIDASGQSVNLLVTGDASQAESAAKDLISSFENLEDIERVVDEEGNTVSFDVKIKGKVVDSISVKDNEGNPKTPDQLNREIYKLVGAEGTYDEWKERNQVGENIGTGGAKSSVAADEIKYNLPGDMVVVGDSKITYDEYFDTESGGNLGASLTELTDSEAKIQKGFTNLLESPNFIPKALKDFYNKTGGEVKVQVGKSGGVNNNEMIITIGDEQIKYEDVFADGETGGTAGIAQSVREAILREIQRANTGESQFASGSDRSEKKKTPLSK